MSALAGTSSITRNSGCPSSRALEGSSSCRNSWTGSALTTTRARPTGRSAGAPRPRRSRPDPLTAFSKCLARPRSELVEPAPLAEALEVNSCLLHPLEEPGSSDRMGLPAIGEVLVGFDGVLDESSPPRRTSAWRMLRRFVRHSTGRGCSWKDFWTVNPSIPCTGSGLPRAKVVRLDREHAGPSPVESWISLVLARASASDPACNAPMT